MLLDSSVGGRETRARCGPRARQARQNTQSPQAPEPSPRGGRVRAA